MGAHARYGKRVMQAAVGSNYYTDVGEPVEVPYEGESAHIDGVIGSKIAVEVESRESKQVRAAVVDLICHPCPKKLLVLIPANMNDVRATKKQCNAIFRQLGVSARRFRVVVLVGRGGRPRLKGDQRKVRVALRELGWRRKGRGRL